ncbi:MAG: hypothetical protein C0392_03570 [Syntrophus sp. (in: bacteria)]|nr:hypothetical protein [Syntrophus sp. (in: bacteria)]
MQIYSNKVIMAFINPFTSAETRFLLLKMGSRNIIILFILVFVVSILDLAGIAIIFPFLQIVTQPGAAGKVFERIGFGSGVTSLKHEYLCAVLSVVMALFYVGKTYFQAELIRMQARMLARFTETLTNEIVLQTLNARYAIFQQTPASEIAGTAYTNTVHASLSLNALMQILNESLLLICLLFGFIVFQPVFAFAALLLTIVAGYVIYITLIRKTTQLSSAQDEVEKVRYRLVFSIASAIRDIKIMGLDRLFNARNSKISHDYSELAWRYSLINSLPRLLIELLALLGVVGVFFAIIIFEIPLHKAGPMLGLVAAVTIRLAPSIQRIVTAANSFKFSSTFLKRLIDLSTRLSRAAVIRIEDSLLFNHSIEMKNVGFYYGDTQILRNVNLELKRCETIGIVGPSGAGKTTLLDLFTGLQQATEGQFICDGVSFDPFTSKSIHNFIGYVPQAITLLDETIAFNISFEESPDHDRVMHALEIANLQELIAALPEGTRTRVGENGLRLSGGQRQRIGIARALYRNPKILVFDEATSSLDTLSEAELTKEIEKLRSQISVVIVAHRLSTVVACDRIYVLLNGEIENSGTHSELLLRSETYKRLYANQHEKVNE